MGTASAATPDIVSYTATPGKYFAMTIDDGPDPTYTPQVLDLLRDRQVQATFSLIGESAQMYPDLVQRIVDEGHRLCNHTWDHSDLQTLTEEQQQAELQQTTDAINAIVPGVPIPYFRAPFGHWTPFSQQFAASQGMQPIGWSVDTQDWSSPGVDEIFNNYKQQFSDRGVILMHDGGGDRSQTVTAMGDILADLATLGYYDDFPATL
ncbi:polysaccharide deacetylase family protein [Saccharopolyspora shandongensis]|uniref:polysaccharide deacetylase family protein n=1 Tax=Saccharopolyspora shandongensis TaxID=418495 RepID=UPI003421E206